MWKGCHKPLNPKIFLSKSLIIFSPIHYLQQQGREEGNTSSSTSNMCFALPKEVTDNLYFICSQLLVIDPCVCDSWFETKPRLLPQKLKGFWTPHHWHHCVTQDLHSGSWMVWPGTSTGSDTKTHDNRGRHVQGSSANSSIPSRLLPGPLLPSLPWLLPIFSAGFSAFLLFWATKSLSINSFFA